MASELHRHQRMSAIAASVLVTAAGGALDAWVYLMHGHTLANAQSGNIVLMSIALVNEELPQVANHLASLAAFIGGMFVSRQAGSLLKQMKLASRDIRLGVECALLVALGFAANVMSDQVIIACVGFIAGVQITSLSHIGPWSFNTGMTTGNLRGAISALSNAISGDAEERAHAFVMAALCVAFAMGAVGGAWLAPRLANLTLLPVAALVAATVAVAPRGVDPLPPWQDLH